MLVCPGVCNRNRRAILGNERFQLLNDVIRRENLGPDRQTGFFCKLFWRTTLNGPTKSFLNLMADDLAKAWLLFYDQKVVWWFGQEAVAYAFGEGLKRVTHLFCTLDSLVDEFVKTRGRLLATRACVGSHNKSAAALPREPIATNEILIRFTDCIVLDFYASGKSTHARQLLTCVKLPRCDQKHDLFRELLPQRNIAVLAE